MSATYSLLYITYGSFLRKVFRLRAEGLENVPKGPVIFAGNHQAILDSVFLLAVLDRKNPPKFMAKAEYFEGGSVRKRFVKWFVSINAVPVDRASKESGLAALASLETVLHQGGSIALHPEGTRVPDGRVYRGKVGAALLAQETDAPIVPVAFIGSRDANPPEHFWPRFGRQVTVRFGDPVTVASHDDPRCAMRTVMQRLAMLAETDYVDIDVRKIA